jgi:uncharacterized membrane protein YqjE
MAEGLGDLSVAELVSRATQQVSTLVRDELALAKAELMEKGRRAGQGVALFAVAGAVAFFGLGALIATAIAALSVVWPVWLAALTVTVLLFVVAGLAVLIGRSRLKAATPLMPVESVQGVTADVETVKTALKDGRRHDAAIH